jgi:UDP-GlcNAc:undecaprenyl-phosphate/decaprenyl-phosphate GlcNAc-1-phosphate transferase
VTPVNPGALLFIAAALVVAAALSFALTPLASRLARLARAMDDPQDERRVHAVPVPRTGGLAVALAFVVVAAGAIAVSGETGAVPQGRSIQPLQLGVLFTGVLFAAVAGFLDDRYQIRARWQLGAQVLLAAFAVAGGITINFVNNPLADGVIRFEPMFAIAVTVVWIVGMINSINFIDGLDGLSSGVGVIAALTLGVISLTWNINQPLVALLCAVLIGSLAGFLPWNFHPARIFVGTSGVYVIGFALAVLSVLGTAKVAVALLVLGVPIIDTFWIIVRRLAAGRSPFTPDRGHLHHRLLDLGLSHRSAVLLIYAICGALAVLSLLLSGAGQLYAFLGILLGGGVLLAVLTRRSQEALHAHSYEKGTPSSST